MKKKKKKKDTKRRDQPRIKNQSILMTIKNGKEIHRVISLEYHQMKKKLKLLDIEMILINNLMK